MRSNPANQIIVRGTCNSSNATFFVDTGSSVSLTSKSFIDSIGLTGKIKKTHVTLSSFTSNVINTHGEIILDINLAHCQVKHRMIITDLVDTHCLIGLDFLKEHQMNIDVTHRCITSKNGKTEFLQESRQLKKTCTLRAIKPYIVPANTVMFIKAKAPDLEMNEGSYSGFVEPKVNMLLNNGLLVDSALCLTDNKTIPLRLTNLTDSPVTVYKNKVLGTLYPVDNKCDGDFRGVKQVTSVPERVNALQENAECTAKTPENPWTKQRLWEELRLTEIVGISNDESHRLKDLVWRYKDCFSASPFDLGECNMFEGDIQLKQDFKHTWIPARPIPYLLREKMEEQINGLEKADVIEKCTDKSLWNSPVFLVKKPHQPDKMRFVVDMRAVNAQCLPDNYQMPLIGHVVDKVGGHKWYSTFDFSQSFHQIKYNKASRPITAFTTANGSRYWFKRLIMGHKTSGAQFSRCMAKIMYNLPFSQLVYFLDDLLLASDTVDTHLSRLKIVFQRLAAAGMKLSPGKSHFLRKEVNFVGITLSGEGLRITEDRAKALTELKAPTDRKSLQSLLGFFGFNRKWIPKYAGLTHCMYQLLRKGVPFKWTQACEENLQKLKDAVTNSVTLCIPDLHDKEQSYVLVVDGSKFGMGAHLSQRINGERRVVGYFSKSIPPHKRDWGQTKLELLTLVNAFKFWEPYLKGTHFKVKTDCLSLTRLDTIFSKNNPTLRRKIQALADYSFDIEHISGAKNSIADFLSRFPFKKKFRDVSTQCDREKDPIKEIAVSQIHSHETTSRKHEEFVNRVTTICDAQNGRETKRLPKEKKPEEADNQRLIPPSFFSQRNKTLKLNGVSDTHSLHPPKLDREKCLCNLIGDVSVKVNAISNNVLSPPIETPVNQSSEDQMPNFSPTISSLSAIRNAQSSDPILSVVKQWLLNGEKPSTIQAFRAPKEMVSYFKQFSMLKLANGIIMRKWVPVKNKVQEEERWLICVPDENREAVLHMCHASLMGNHPGIKLTLDICRRYYYWPGMSPDVELFVKACITCGRVKQPQAYSKAKRKHIIAHKFNDILVIDHIEPEKLGMTASGNKYILSMTDAYSGYVVAAATNSQKADQNIALIMHKWVLIHGVPREIISDNASGFRATFYQAVLKSLNCKYTYGLPYECRSSSKAERTNKRLNQSLRLVLEGKNPKTWDKYLNYICSALNSLKSRSTGYTANFLVYGHELNTPLSLLLENGDLKDLSGNDEPVSFDKKAYDLHSAYRSVIHKVRKNLNAYYAYSDMNFNNGIKNPPFKAGDYCFVLIRCPTHKFAPRWHGPVKIIKAVNDNVYVIQLGDVEKVMNISKLKRYDSNKYSPNLVSAIPPPNQPSTEKNLVSSGQGAELIFEQEEKETTCLERTIETDPPVQHQPDIVENVTPIETPQPTEETPQPRYNLRSRTIAL